MRGGEGAGVSDFFTINSNLKSKDIFFGGGGGRWMDRRTGPNQFAAPTSCYFEIHA